MLGRQYDALLASSMVDLAGLLGLNPALSNTPSALYFHENQFAYPQGSGKHSTVELQLSSIMSALAAHRLVFNSEFNRQSFLNGSVEFLRKMPGSLAALVSEALRPKTSVLPVPISTRSVQATCGERRSGAAVSIVWNHRWEYDKGPERLLAFANALLRTNIDFVLHVIGQQFRECPTEFDTLHDMLRALRPRAIGQWGYIEDRQTYEKVLDDADFVLSTAIHDFQGLSILEAVQRGCRPLLPRRLAYPEWCPEEYLYESVLTNADAEASHAVALLEGLLARESPLPSVSALEWQVLGPQYSALIQRLCEQC